MNSKNSVLSPPLTASKQHPKPVKRAAVITGAAGGIGFELARLLNQDDYNLILIDLRHEQLAEARQKLQAEYLSNPIKLIVKDLSKADDVESIFWELDPEYEVDILINNAGFGVFGFFHQSDWERENRMINLHIHALTRLTKLFLPGMINRRSGKVLNVASIAGFQPGPLMAIYYATKAYVVSFSQAIANELKGTGVSVTALCPGVTPTGFQAAVGAGDFELHKKDWLMTSAETVARKGYRDLLKSKTISIPGKQNVVLANLSRFIPRDLGTAILRRIQEKSRR